MNASFVQLAAKYPRLLGLSDLLHLRVNQITKDHLVRVADAVGVAIPFNDEIVNAFIALLRGKNINDVADLLQSPESVGALITFLQGGYRSLVEAAKVEAGFDVEAGEFFIS